MARPPRHMTRVIINRLGRRSPAPPVQPALLVSIANGVLVFCGLITAIAATVLSSADKVVAPADMKPWLAGAAALALLAGILVLGAMTAAHNLARRAEKGAPRPKISHARTVAGVLSTGANLTAAVAAIALLWGLKLFVFAPPAPSAGPGPVQTPAIDLTISQTCAPVVKVQPEPFCK